MQKENNGFGAEEGEFRDGARTNERNWVKRGGRATCMNYAPFLSPSSLPPSQGAMTAGEAAASSCRVRSLKAWSKERIRNIHDRSQLILLLLARTISSQYRTLIGTLPPFKNAL